VEDKVILVLKSPAMKKYRGVEMKFHAISASALKMKMSYNNNNN
jgi:hypothetical protein